MIERWKCVGYCVHCSADEDDSTFSKEWGHFEKSSDGAWVRADSAQSRIRDLEKSLAKYQACRVHDVDEKAWLSKRVTELEADLAHKDAYYAQFTMAPKTTLETEVGK